MSTAATARAPLTRTWQAWVLVTVEVFVAYQAFSGGAGLISDSWQLPTEWLLRTPFDTWVGPGWVLIALVGVPHVLAAVPVVFLPARPRLGILAGLLAGGSLLVWIAVQIALLQVYFFLQPVIAGLGLVEAGLAFWWLARLRRAVVAGEAEGTDLAPEPAARP